MRYKLTTLLLALTVALGCNVQWIPADPLVIDPNPPAPIADRSLRVVIVEETGDRPALPAGQLSILTSPAARQWLDQHCDKLQDGTRAWRIVDKDAVGGLPRELVGVSETPAESLPWLYVTDGSKGLSCPLPDSVDAFLVRLKPFATEHSEGVPK